MSDLQATEHLKIAKRLHFQGQNEDAIREYQLVLEIEPENTDAANGLRALGVEPPDPSERPRTYANSATVKTGFFVNQAKSSELPAWRTGPFKVIIILLGGLLVWGLYNCVIMLLNFDNIKAAQNVDAHISRVTAKEDGDTFVDVKVSNYNPGPIKDLVLDYSIVDDKGNVLKDGKVPIRPMVPAGDTRTFADIDLGQLKGKPEKVSEQKIESLVYGPKPKIRETLADKFVEASQKPDTDAFEDYDELSQDLDTFPPVLIGLGRAYAAKSGKTPSNWKHAIEMYKKAIECEPDNANAHYYLAVAYYYTKDITSAKKEIARAAELAPDDPLIDFSQRDLFHTKDPKADKAAEADLNKDSDKAKK